MTNEEASALRPGDIVQFEPRAKSVDTSVLGTFAIVVHVVHSGAHKDRPSVVVRFPDHTGACTIAEPVQIGLVGRCYWMPQGVFL